MRRWAFVISILGIFILFLILLFSKGREINSEEELEGLEVNSKVIVYGTVERERTFGKNYILELENGMELISEGFGYAGRNIGVFGRVWEFEGKRRVEVLRIID